MLAYARSASAEQVLRTDIGSRAAGLDLAEVIVTAILQVAAMVRSVARAAEVSAG